MSFSEEKKGPASNPKKKFGRADLRSMHDLLSKNMYKIRERVRRSYSRGDNQRNPPFLFVMLFVLM